MKSDPIITKVEIHEFRWHLEDIGLDPTGTFCTYRPGDKYARTGGALRLYTDMGVVGEFAGWGSMEAAFMKMFSGCLLGQNALQRERIYKEMKQRANLQQHGRVGMGIVDIALWDLAGKFYDSPIYKLLGGYRTKLPAYASTMNGGDSGGLSTPESYADFAEQCLEIGYPAFKIHPWPHGAIRRHVDAVHAVGKRVGGKMDLMLDPFCRYETFGEAVTVGRACDEEGFFWWEDPYNDGGVSELGHSKLRQLVKTPLLEGENIRGLEPRANLFIAHATDFIRGDPVDDGITATMKLAHAAEAVGIDIEYHGCGPAQRHCMAATRNSNYYEMVWVHPQVRSSMPPIYQNGYEDGLCAVDRDGCVAVPEGPGLGVAYNWDFIMAHRTGGMEWAK